MQKLMWAFNFDNGMREKKIEEKNVEVQEGKKSNLERYLRD